MKLLIYTSLLFLCNVITAEFTVGHGAAHINFKNLQNGKISFELTNTFNPDPSNPQITLTGLALGNGGKHTTLSGIISYDPKFNYYISCACLLIGASITISTILDHMSQDETKEKKIPQRVFRAITALFGLSFFATGSYLLFKLNH